MRFPSKLRRSGEKFKASSPPAIIVAAVGICLRVLQRSQLRQHVSCRRHNTLRQARAVQTAAAAAATATSLRRSDPQIAVRGLRLREFLAKILRFVADEQEIEQHKAQAKQPLFGSGKTTSEFKPGDEIGGVGHSPEFVERDGEIGGGVEAEVV